MITRQRATQGLSEGDLNELPNLDSNVLKNAVP